MMKAVMWTAYGGPDVLELREMPKPAPKAGEVLIRVCAATVTLGDCEVRSMTLPMWVRVPLQLYMGIDKPRRTVILGQELAGEVEAVGEGVTRFKAGDAVFAAAATAFRFGAYAEYACLPASFLVMKPARMGNAEAATIPTAGINALHFVRAANIARGQTLLINGAGGGIGTYAVQIARSLGAEVTAVDSAAKLAMLRSIGADHVIDYAREDFTQNGETYDAIMDVVGKSSFSQSIRCLKTNGRYVLCNPSLSGMLRGQWVSMTTERKVISRQVTYAPEAYAVLVGMMEAGVLKPVMDRSYPLAQVAEAHRYVEAGHKQGNVVIVVARSTDG
jgi:NADPH:quinone reductase-like Zn-dependent oxidoreductase